MRGTKICFAASSGGHLEEIARLRELTQEYDSFLLTEKGSFQGLNFCEQIYYVPQINRRELFFLPKFIWLFVKSFVIIRKEQPDFVVSTGALATYPICVWAKLLKKKIIYIESFARVDGPSLTGKLMYKMADLFLVQWEEMLRFFPDATYCGGIF
ncbi:MAG: polysaccharide biosynthesis protein [Acetatifactor sp.]|jgi:UDP-N-acetylglucosamine:LPS N-acetylglucosamine transferase|nr:polysaccharide biosynthesis protein [Acetatifactor sp.]